MSFNKLSQKSEGVPRKNRSRSMLVSACSVLRTGAGVFLSCLALPAAANRFGVIGYEACRQKSKNQSIKECSEATLMLAFN
ncbi:MAG: hypothetical protein ACI8PP_002889 [Candidatus Pseudothioglobus sp.]|jgi:hypothetical protein